MGIVDTWGVKGTAPRLGFPCRSCACHYTDIHTRNTYALYTLRYACQACTHTQFFTGKANTLRSPRSPRVSPPQPPPPTRLLPTPTYDRPMALPSPGEAARRPSRSLSRTGRPDPRRGRREEGKGKGQRHLRGLPQAAGSAEAARSPGSLTRRSGTAVQPARPLLPPPSSLRPADPGPACATAPPRAVTGPARPPGRSWAAGRARRGERGKARSGRRSRRGERAGRRRGPRAPPRPGGRCGACSPLWGGPRLPPRPGGRAAGPSLACVGR